MEGQYGHWAKLAFSASCSGFELLASSQHGFVPTESMTMAFVELEECISIFALYISFFFFFFNYFFLGIHVQNSCHLDFFSWIILCLSHLCHAYMCSYVGRKLVIKVLVSCILVRHCESLAPVKSLSKFEQEKSLSHEDWNNLFVSTFTKSPTSPAICLFPRQRPQPDLWPE